MHDYLIAFRWQGRSFKVLKESCPGIGLGLGILGLQIGCGDGDYRWRYCSCHASPSNSCGHD